LEDFLVIDALFGIGINRPLTGLYEKVIQYINAALVEVIAIDMPSGLTCDDAPQGDSKVIIRANFTLTFEQLKFSLLLAQNAHFVGKWIVIPIHLHPDFIENETSDYFVLEKSLIKSLLKPRAKFSHKGSFGHALLCAGSFGKIGAAVLATKSCLRSGVGLVTISTPKIGYSIVQQSVPEAMAIVDDNENELSNCKDDVSVFNTIGVGPGIGTSELTQRFLNQLLSQSKNPMVLDADALNCIALNDSLRDLIPQNSILTPHPKEFLRLIHAQQPLSDYEKIEQQRQFSIENKCIVVLKGAHTTISNSNGQVYFNTTGNAGMATGGSGDVLTGLLTGLLAQGYEPFDAARIGVFLHGLAGDLAAEIQGQDALIASDIIEEFGAAFLSIQQS
jgi:NAD(P)H-hydrate epimerase